MIALTGIAVYPLKSAGGGARREATVEPWGLAGDRRWALIDADGNGVWAVRTPAVMRITARPGPDDSLVLRAAGLPDLRVPTPVTGEAVSTRIARLDRMIVAGPAAHAWASEAIGQRVRLAWLDDPGRRTVSADHGGRPGDRLSLADAGPLLLTSEASLRQVEDWVTETVAGSGEERPEPLSMTRFRPNLVIDGAAPFAEDAFSRVRVGDVEFRLAERCDRCATTLYDPATVQRGKEPLRSLARHRRVDGKVWFGVRLVPVSTGVIRVGDPVSVD